MTLYSLMHIMTEKSLDRHQSAMLCQTSKQICGLIHHIKGKSGFESGAVPHFGDLLDGVGTNYILLPQAWLL